MKVPIKWAYSFIEPIRRHKSFVGLVLIIVGSCIFAGILAGIKYNNSSLLLSFSNVVVVKFLRGSTGFAGMMFSNIFIVMIFSGIIIVSCRKKYFVSIGLFFYGYYVYAQTLTLLAFLLEYGIMNTFVIAVCMLLYMIIMLFLFLQLFLIGLDMQSECNYFKSAVINCLPILLCIALTIIIQCVVLMVLKNFIIVLVY